MSHELPSLEELKKGKAEGTPTVPPEQSSIIKTADNKVANPEYELEDKAEEILRNWEDLRSNFGKLRALIENVPATFLNYQIRRDFESLCSSVPLERFMESLRAIGTNPDKNIDFEPPDVFIRDFGRFISDLAEGLNKTEVFMPPKSWLTSETSDGKMRAGKLVDFVPETGKLAEELTATYRRITTNIKEARRMYKTVKKN